MEHENLLVKKSTIFNTGGSIMKPFNAFKKPLSNRLMERRQFLKVMSAAGLSAALPEALFPKLGIAKTPEYGGRLRVGVGHGSTSDSLDPGQVGTNGFMGILNYATHNHLGVIGLDGKLKPELAESWDSSADAKTWVFKLRRGVEFHNGKTLDAADVIASINYHRGENSKSGGKEVLSEISEIAADGSETVVFRLKDGNAGFPYTICDQHCFVLPLKDGELNWRDGTGPFVLKEFNPGVRAMWTRHKNYFKEGLPYFDELEIITIPDDFARVNAIRSGEVDVIDRVNLKTVDKLKQVQNIKVEETSGRLFYSLPMDARVAPFNNNDVRLALKYSIDREDLLKRLLHGHGKVGNDHPISPSYSYFATDLEQRTYDPDKAKFHLKRAGYSDGIKVPLHASDAAYLGAVDTGVLYKNSAAKAGIEIDLVREPNDGYWSNVWLKKPWCFSYWLGRPTEDMMFQNVYSSGVAWNESHWEHDRFNKLLVEARSELNENKRRVLYAEMQLILSNEGATIIPLFGNYVFALTTKVEHGPLHSHGDLDGQRFMERWWFM
jgi:peptide/nickel transport system substrate-binding protein